MPEHRKEDLYEDDVDMESATEMPVDSAENGGKSPLAEMAQRVRRILHLDQLAVFWATREPHLWATLWAMLGVTILLGLGTWQVLRSHEKNALIAQVQHNLAAAPHDLTVNMPETPDAWADLHYKPVRMTGTWMTLRDFRLAPRSYAEQRGYQWIIPFRLESGKVILVNRGFVPDNTTLVPPDEADIQVIYGVGYAAKAEKPRYVPENRPSKGEWIWMDVAAMAHEVGVKDVAPVVVYESRVSDKNSYPIGGQIPLPFHNRHWHYAITWYAMALALMGVWIVASGPKPAVENTKSDAQSDGEQAEMMDPVARRDRYPEATD